MKKCPCDSGKMFTNCCQPFIEGRAIPPTPESLMRSRYTAYTHANTDYIAKTMKGKASLHFDQQEARHWASQAQWLGLIILRAQRNNVTFIARYQSGGKEYWLCERSEFQQEDGRWYYTDGAKATINRNELCPCGSGKKFKRCHSGIYLNGN